MRFNSFGNRLKVLVPWAVAVLLALTSAPATAQPEYPGSRAYPYHEHTPSAHRMERARRAYRAGWYFSAYHHYLSAARWADKFAQFNVGVMYLRGEGVDFDAGRGWAWIKLSAERGYPDMVRMADDLHAMLDETQRQQARSIYERELLPEYGDAVRIPVTAERMERNRRRATGSRLGSRNFLRIVDSFGRTRDGDEYYDPAKWDFHNIVAYETHTMLNLPVGSVVIGGFETVDDDP
ncbi:MAG: hypothetical protein V2J10_03745 [Wenzhouxiangella sp.]|nr:hypothetical protein [Wenzhouxiangella sp.]